MKIYYKDYYIEDWYANRVWYLFDAKDIHLAHYSTQNSRWYIHREVEEISALFKDPVFKQLLKLHGLEGT